MIVAIVEPTRGAITHGVNLAGEPRDTSAFDDVALGDADVAPAPAGIDPTWLYARGALARTVQMGGALERILDISIEYAQQRTQFGQPIGHFQAIQHQLVLLAGDVAAARTAADLACSIAETQQPEATFAIAAAKARVSAAIGNAAAIAHQVHGAIGFTQEHSLQLSTRRLWSWRDEFGSETYWATILGRMTLEAGADAFWPNLAVSHVMGDG
jgi:acyl-CoA dehydrogenase